jgi:hypothetical protein
MDDDWRPKPPDVTLGPSVVCATWQEFKRWEQSIRAERLTA